MSLEIVRVYCVSDTIQNHNGKALAQPYSVVVAAAVVKNPFLGLAIDEVERSAKQHSIILGELLAEKLKGMLVLPAMTFGKATLIGQSGEVFHGSALIHTKEYGDTLRALSKGVAPVTAAEKLGNPGTTLDLSLRRVHEDGTLATLSIKHLTTYEFTIPGAPKADEIVVISVVSDGMRPDWRL